MNEYGRTREVWLKDWIRLRGKGRRHVVDPGVFASVRGLSGSGSPDLDQGAVSFDAGVGSSGVQDVYYEGRVQQAGDELMTPDGPRELPVRVSIRYFTGPEG
ncbi:MAG: hypothetical protein LC750_18520, partial [Actinobacteria bacterium]|nr:hypothetical protein [Actinomycetota bacterium]